MGISIRRILERKYFLPLFLFFASLIPFLFFQINFNSLLLYRDISNSALPDKMFWLRGILETNRIPRWNFLQAGGAPFYADPMGSSFYPLNILFLIFGLSRVPEALTTYIIVHYPLIFLGYYFLWRELKFSIVVASIMALEGAWCGYALSSYHMIHILSGVLALPWFFLFFSKYLRTRRNIHAFSASFFLALPVLGGDPQFTYMFCFISLFYVILFRRSIRTLSNLGLVCILAVMCSAIQLIPTLELLHHSQRDSGIELWQKIWALHPVRVIEMIFPHFFGSNSTFGEFNFWGGKFTNSPYKQSFIHSVYLGFFPVYLISWAIGTGLWIRQWRHRSSFRKMNYALCFLLILPMGSINPIWNLLRYLPLWNSFRYPERLTLYFVALFLFFACLNLRAFFLFFRISTQKVVVRVTISIGLFWVLFSGFLFFLFRNQPNHGAPELFISSFVFILSAILIFLKRKEANMILPLVLVFFLFFELQSFFPENVWFQRKNLIQENNFPATMKILTDLNVKHQDRLQGRADRVLSPNSYNILWQFMPKEMHLDSTELSVFADWEALAGNLPSFFGIPSVHSFYTLELKRRVLVEQSLIRERPQDLVNLMGAFYLLERFPDRPPIVRLNQFARRNFYFSKQAIPVQNFDAALEKLKLTADLSAVDFVEGLETAVEISDELPQVKLISQGDTTKFHIETSTATERLVFQWNQSFYPAWSAYFQKKKITILPSNGWAMAVLLPPLPKGSFDLEFRFESDWISVGQALSALWLILLGVVGISSMCKKENQAHVS